MHTSSAILNAKERFVEQGHCDLIRPRQTTQSLPNNSATWQKYALSLARQLCHLFADDWGAYRFSMHLLNCIRPTSVQGIDSVLVGWSNVRRTP